MTITLDGTGGLFPIVRELIDCVEAANLAQGTTVPAEGEAILAALTDLDTIDGSSLVTRLVAAMSSYRSSTSLQTALAQFARELVINRVRADAPEIPSEIDRCLDELIRQMLLGSGETVERNVVSVSVGTTPGTDAPSLVASVVDPLGDALEGAIDEDITGTWMNATTLQLRSGDAERNASSYAWPAGSGISNSLLLETQGVVDNYSFDEDDDMPNIPDNWIVAVGTPLTDVSLTDTEIQSITIAGTPTSGYWTISHTRADGYVQTTVPLAFDATAADVQTALSALVGLEDVTVTATGTSPNQTFSVEFNAVAPAGDQAMLTTANTFDTGTIAVGQSLAGVPATTYRSLALLGDGAKLLTLRSRVYELPLLASTVYAVSLQARKATGTTGTLIIELVDGAGTVLNDDAGTANQITIDLSTLATTFAAQTGFFRTPDMLPEIYYLQLRLSVAINSAHAAYLDDLIVAKATQLYTGGPYAALLAGSRELDPDDRYVITVANDWAGQIQSWFYRWFGRLLPSAAAGAQTISD
jgi:hypothetical protein